MSNEKRRTTKPGSIREQLSDMNVMGKMPPQATDLEEAVLGAIMLESNAIIQVIDFLRPESFYMEKHGIIFRACKYLFDQSMPIDILTVTQHLKSTGEIDLIGGAFYISNLTSHVAAASNVEFHGRIILQKYVQRETIRSASEIIKLAYEPETDIFDLLDKRQNELNNLISGIIRKTEQGSARIFGDFIKHLEVVAKNESSITGVPSSLKAVDALTRGYQPTDLIVIAARPAMGKTAAVKTIIRGAVNELKRGVLFFSLEMSNQQNAARLLSEDVQVPSNHFNSKEFLQKTNFQQLNEAVTQYIDKNGKDLLIIDDTPSLKINELRARAKLICNKHDISVIVVDYLQLIKGEGENTAYQVENTSQGLKALAKELNIPVVALAQLNRNVEQRGASGTKMEKEPQLSDLRSSGGIEQNADVVIFLHRPEYYGILEDEEGQSTREAAYFIFAKNRNGGTGKVKIRFKEELTLFTDWTNPAWVGSPLSTGNIQQAYDAKAGLEPDTSFTQTVVTKNKNPFATDVDEDPF